MERQPFKSVTKRLILSLLSALFLTFSLLSASIYLSSRKYIHDNAFNHARNISSNILNTLDSRILGVEQIPQAIHNLSARMIMTNSGRCLPKFSLPMLIWTNVLLHSAIRANPRILHTPYASPKVRCFIVWEALRFSPTPPMCSGKTAREAAGLFSTAIKSSVSVIVCPCPAPTGYMPH